MNSRSQEDLTEFDVSSSIDLGRFLPEKAGVRLPMYYGYSQSVATPKYNPLEPDIELDESLDRLDTREEKDSLKFIAQDVITRKSINFTNVRIEPQREKTKTNLWDPENFSVSYSYNETYRRDINTEYNRTKTYRGMFSYNYNNRPKLITPFSKIGLLNKWPLKAIGSFNFYPLPTQISFRSEIYRLYHETKSRNITNPNLILPATYEKDFLINSYLDIRYDVTRSLKVDFSSNSTARIDEPQGRMNRNEDDYQMKKDSILQNLWELGRPTLYGHNINVRYTIPLSRIKMLSFMNSSVRYTGTYNWNAGPITDETINLGNTVQNSGNWQFTGNMNLVNLYNKVPYFQKVNQNSSEQVEVDIA